MNTHLCTIEVPSRTLGRWAPAPVGSPATCCTCATIATHQMPNDALSLALSFSLGISLSLPALSFSRYLSLSISTCARYVVILLYCQGWAMPHVPLTQVGRCLLWCRFSAVPDTRCGHAGSAGTSMLPLRHAIGASIRCLLPVTR